MKNNLFIFFLLPMFFFGQTTIGNFAFTNLPLNKQLYARDENNKGTVLIEGQYDMSQSLNYDIIQIRVNRNGVRYTGSPYNYELLYSGVIATFNFSIEIDAELANYSFEIRARIGGGSWDKITTIEDIVAGDVYIIQGQSNAVAQWRTGSTYIDDIMDRSFIRVFGGGTNNSAKLLNNQSKWYIGQGDVAQYDAGNTGQWGLKLANMLVTNKNIPIAIFNAASSGQAIKYFQKKYTDPDWDMNNYEKLLYRLETTGLKNSVKAVFWAQGEKDNTLGTTTNEYISSFENLKSSWFQDYPNIEKFYIFQIDGCGSGFSTKKMNIKEAQRRLAVENDDIHIMTIAALEIVDGDCHYTYTNGYEKFATRIYNLVDRDFYGGSNDTDIEPPMITGAYLSGNTMLTVETDASALSMDYGATDFYLDDAEGATITNIEVDGNNIIFSLSKNPGASATISYHAIETFNLLDNFITNTRGLELVCFYKYEIEKALFSAWDGNSWSNGRPNKTINAFINGDYSALEGNIEAHNLTIDSNLNFNNQTGNSVIIYGDLTINSGGSFIIGDKESLVMYNNEAIITGSITKLESSTKRSNVHDITYWSSPVISRDAIIGNIFSGVDENRIFYYDQSRSIVTDPKEPGFWGVWVKASQNMKMTAGQGFSSEGVDDAVHNISFTGKPNNGRISISITKQDTGNNYSLIGNPYPSSIDIYKFFEANNNVDEIHLWTHITPIINEFGDYISADYASFNRSGGIRAASGGTVPSNKIGSGQGFIAENSGSDHSITFTNEMRIVEANDQFFKSSNSEKKSSDVGTNDRIWLNLTSDKSSFNQILIVFKSGLSDKVDPGYDTRKFSGSRNPVSFYSVIEKDKYVIQGKRAFTLNRKVKLGFDTNISPQLFTISIDNTEGALKDAVVYLVDNFLKVTHNLSESNYEFTQTIVGDFPNRFILKFKPDDSNDDNIVKHKESISDYIVYHDYFYLTTVE